MTTRIRRTGPREHLARPLAALAGSRAHASRLSNRARGQDEVKKMRTRKTKTMNGRTTMTRMTTKKRTKMRTTISSMTNGKKSTTKSDDDERTMRRRDDEEWEEDDEDDDWGR